MTAQGSPLTRLRREIASGDPLLALTAATEVAWVPLEDALALCLVLRDAEDRRFERAVLRWHARAVDERGISTTSDAAFVLAGLQALASPAVPSAASTLAHWLRVHGQERVAAVLERSTPARWTARSCGRRRARGASRGSSPSASTRHTCRAYAAQRG